jgi:hypothetical protein
MTKRSTIALGKWLRFDRYELREGTIAPARGAKSREYDPWNLKERPYKALAQLVASRPAHDVLALPAEQPELVQGVLDWCNEYGLLGALYHRIAMVTLWPRWDRVEFAESQLRDSFQPRQDVHVCLPAGWQTQTSLYAPSNQDPRCLGTPLNETDLPRNARKAGALVMELDGSVITDEPLDKTWGTHFPDVPYAQRATYAYPHPATKEFWDLYGEPVSEFVTAAWLLVNGIEAITKPANRSSPDRGAIRLAHLAAYGVPYLARERDRSRRQRWVAGSLLSSLAYMAMEDISRNLLHQCGTCNTFFLSEAYQAEYCSSTCRNTMQKRRYRKRRLKEERNTRRRGH